MKNRLAVCLITGGLGIALLSPNSHVQSAPPQPDVRIVPEQHGMVEEYRWQGQLYMIRVIPNHGPPYYLVDSDGDGDLDRRSSELDPKLLIPSWVLFRW